MIIMAIDPATTTGWSILKDDTIVKFGSITCPSEFSLPQRLNFFHLHIVKLIEEYHPDYMAIEDVILGISGARTLAYLARINGVIVQTAYQFLLDKVFLYDPTYWKSHSLPAIVGNSPKWKIQLEVARFLQLNMIGDFSKYDKFVSDEEEKLKNDHIDLVNLKTQISKLKSENLRKRNPVDEIKKFENVNKIKIMEKKHHEMKDGFKLSKKVSSKVLSKIGNDVYAQTGISNDIADSICIALCLRHNLNIKN